MNLYFIIFPPFCWTSSNGDGIPFRSVTISTPLTEASTGRGSTVTPWATWWSPPPSAMLWMASVMALLTSSGSSPSWSSCRDTSAALAAGGCKVNVKQKLLGNYEPSRSWHDITESKDEGRQTRADHFSFQKTDLKTLITLLTEENDFCHVLYRRPKNWKKVNL